MTERPIHHIRLRVPEELFLALKTNCFVNRRSLNSEIIFGLEQYLNSTAATKKASEHVLENRSDASHHNR